MKFSKLTIALSSAAVLFTVGCATANNVSTVSEESLGLRKTTIYSEANTIGDKTMYSTEVAGASKKINRAFQDAPPMIPHSVDGLLPITINNNQCTSCHEPAIATSMGATPIPKSHFMDFRPKHNYDGKTFTKAVDNMKNEVSVKPISQVSGARFNCTQCHTPQSTGKLIVDNTFEPAYTRKDGAFKSTWDEVILDNLDTLKK
ncbi:nitrate reductase cytochrome c-type subunit [Poseidonibacter lekithochrous]|uniref:nitrate reductase cytochrome c-type subunit n=1 Tax=Poseidonibacter lekithochrous TaxID=1904463 RepID=UPI0008FC7F96|nr:nitrate reductase cytochrome c-type subunit [Poseidonibacter lekithochrous]QKJ22297.1 periplasmic nitrate reductase NapAB, small subunit, periplasmic diheme cytochrome c550 protein [Poseidonibacter lekithochrous]